MNAKELLHIWASQSKEKGKCGNVFFEGKSVFSYGHHYEMARIVGDIVLMNSDGYSATTRKHKSWCRSAVSNKTVIEVPTFDEHKENAEWLLKGLEADLFKLARARKYIEDRRDRYEGRVDTVLEYADAFKKQIGAKLYKQVLAVWKRRADPFTPAIKKQFEARTAANRERAKQERIEQAAREAARRAEYQAKYDGWKRGDEARLPWDAVNSFPVALRVVTVEGHDVIETTRGASVPVIEARKFWNTLTTDGAKAVLGMRLGHYTVSTVSAETLVVGCHVIPMREVARMAIRLKFDTGTVDGLVEAFKAVI